MQNDKSASNRPNDTCRKVSNSETPKNTHRRGIESKLPWPVEMLSPHSLRPSHRNARTHSKKQIQQISESMLRFGAINPVIVDHRRRIVAGHARAEAAKVLDLERIPVIRLSHLNETEIRAYMLADNKLTEKAGWDREKLAIELEDLQIALPEVGLDIGITGFDPGEIDSLIVDFAEGRPDPADHIPNIEEGAPVAREGDLFSLGQHRLLVGDARDSKAYVQLMQSEKALMAFLDPPTSGLPVM
jgi:hypothetical protein